MNFLDTASTMHTRGVNIDMKDYLYALLIANGEDKGVAYAIAYEPSEFKKNLGEDEGVYIASKQKEAENLESQQGIKMLLDIIKDERRGEIQAHALNLKDYKFTGEQTVQILNNLLKSRISDFDAASVKDIVALLKALMEQGGLDVGDGGFGRHFVQIYPKLQVVCPICHKETDIALGLTSICSRCGAQFTWSEEERRYYPEPIKL